VLGIKKSMILTNITILVLQRTVGAPGQSLIKCLNFQSTLMANLCTNVHKDYLFWEFQRFISKIIENSLVFLSFGDQFRALEASTLGESKSFLVDEHILCLLNWLFCDNQSPALEPFHAVPVHVSGHINFLFEGSTHGDTTMNVIHRYCMENWKCLDCFMGTIIGFWMLL
jgi:hypothetical protein